MNATTTAKAAKTAKPPKTQEASASEAPVAAKKTPVAKPKAPPVAKAAAKKAPATAKPAKPSAEAEVPAGKSKEKLVRDSFTMPRADFELIAKLKERALGFKHPVKKSELLRAGLQALAALDEAALASRLGGLTPLKTGRPKKHG